MEKKKIFSGDFKYVCRVSRNFAALGWRIVKQKRWGDGKWTFIMEDRKSTRLNSSHIPLSRMPSSA